jgi:hypothetical protein
VPTVLPANELDRSFWLKKANRYRMEDHITVMGLKAVAIHDLTKNKGGNNHELDRTQALVTPLDSVLLLIKEARE